MRCCVPKSLLIITGTMGSGKSAVLGEASDLLARRGAPHAAIDVDALGIAQLPSNRHTDAVMYDNLRCVCRNYAALGIQRFLLARAVQDHAQLARLREIIPASHTIICRLIASAAVLEQRVGLRECGIARERYIARVAALNDLLDRAKLEDVAVVNEGRPLTAVALEVLIKAGWVSPAESHAPQIG